MDGSLLLLLMTVLPALFGIVCYLIPGFELKKYVVILCALVLTVASLLVLSGGAQTLSVESIGLGAGIPLSPIILVLDYLLLLTFLYFGIKDKEYKAVLLAILQLIPLTYLEFFMPKAEHAAGTTFVMDNLAIVMCLIVSIMARSSSSTRSAT